MKQFYLKLFCGAFLAWTLVACRTEYELTSVSGSCIPVDSKWDRAADTEADALLAPYKLKVDSAMAAVVGTADISMEGGRPESLLSNLIADVLRETASEVVGKPVDMGLMNVGGIRATLTKGDITTANVYEILPFENALCILTLKGSALKQLFENLAMRRGEGVSGVRLAITEDGKLVEGTVGGKPVQDDKDYLVATIDYLAEGNDGMSALLSAGERVCPQGYVLRDVFMRYVKRQAAAGKGLTSQMEGRITVKK